MKKLLYILFLVIGLSVVGNQSAYAAHQFVDSCAIQVQDGDTLYLAWLHEVWVYPPLKFKNRRQEKFYWKTVRDVKKCLPYAKMITKDMAYADEELAKLPDNKSRKKWWALRNTRRISGICTPAKD